MPDPRIRLDRLKFFEDLGYEPHPGQLEIHFDERPRRVVACGVRWDKTLCAAMEGLAAAMAPNAPLALSRTGRVVRCNVSWLDMQLASGVPSGTVGGGSRATPTVTNETAEY